MLPVGISFLVFRMLTYVIDIYRGQLEPAPTLDFGVYVAFFPYLVAGPIVRAGSSSPSCARHATRHASTPAAPSCSSSAASPRRC